MTITKIEWQMNKKSLLIWTLSLSIIVVLFMSIFPSMSNSAMADMMTTKLSSLPENMLKAFHLNSGPSLIEPTGYFAYVFQYIFIAASIYAVMLGSKMLVKEETEGTIEFLYAQPVSRSRIIGEKMVASIAMIGLFWLVIYGFSLGATVFFNNTKFATKDIVIGLSKIFATEWFVLLFFLCLGFLLSSLLKQANLGISMGLVFIFYLGGIMGDLEEKLSFLKDISPMAQAGPAAVLEKDFSWGFAGILFGISILLFILARLTYQRKDLNV
ncbi:ABC transporter permease subunit [Vagococcus sp. DIV0080]|uniref:ABC transporter permease subunit n=1 Tax=Candidatus Vagococcus giribetii TaxID=2230876 RepID=A0ABS3HRV6_9ENTE|nr:ABC transporter permease subunit [Vagococcus sp. DIV0080]MBO0476487.1 ABC transporter permease subunit [Vagococcus sp. DIV0080]